MIKQCGSQAQLTISKNGILAITISPGSDGEMVRILGDSAWAIDLLNASIRHHAQRLWKLNTELSGTSKESNR